MRKLKVSLSFLILAVLFSCNKQVKNDLDKKENLDSPAKEILLLGTFHYHNPGLDVTKVNSYDILSTETQNELELLASKIKAFNPSKIFVEWDYTEQAELDSLFNLYKEGKYFLNDSLSDFYLKNEIFQLSFRVAKKTNLNKVYGVDFYDVDMPFRKLPEILEKNGQDSLQKKIDETRTLFELEFNNKIKSGASLIELMSFINSPRFKYLSDEYLHRLPLLVGTQDDFTGPKITSEWYRRNLYIWSMIEKNVDDDDQRIMVLFGGSHTSILSDFIKNDDKWKIVEFKSIL